MDFFRILLKNNYLIITLMKGNTTMFNYVEIVESFQDKSDHVFDILLEYIDHEIYNEDEMIATESVVDSIKNFFTMICDKIKEIVERISRFIY